MIITDIDGGIQTDGFPVGTRCTYILYAELLKCRPVPDAHAAIHQRHFDQVVQRIFLLLRQFGAKKRDHHVPAGQHTSFCANLKYFFPLHVDNFHFAGSGGAVDVSCGDHNAIQANSNRKTRVVQAIVFDSCGHYVLNRVARDGSGYQIANE